MLTDVRLVDGPTLDRGTVEIKEDNMTWVTTCGENLGINDVIVICKQLGFTGASRAIENTPYEHDSIPTTVLNCMGGKHFFYYHKKRCVLPKSSSFVLPKAEKVKHCLPYFATI